MTYGDDHTITTLIVSCWCGWQQHQTCDGSTTPSTAFSHVCSGRPAKEPSAPTVAEMAGTFEGGPDSVAWLREQRDAIAQAGADER